MSATVGAHGLVAGDEAVPLFLGEFAVDDRAGLLDEAGDVERNLDHLARSRQPQGIRLGVEPTTWGDQTEDWADRGIERAAKTIAYTLGFDDLPDGLGVRQYVCAFEIPTGMPVPADVPVTCDTDSAVVETPAVEAGAPQVFAGKDAGADPRLAPPTIAVRSNRPTQVTWSWEHHGPGSNSLATAWPSPSEAP